MKDITCVHLFVDEMVREVSDAAYEMAARIRDLEAENAELQTKIRERDAENDDLHLRVDEIESDLREGHHERSE